MLDEGSSQIQWMPWNSTVTQEKRTSFVALEQSNKYSQIVFINFSLFLTG